MEKKENIVIGIGRFQPPTAGHYEMAKKIKELAEFGDANHAIFTFHSYGDKKNPLPPDVKAKHMETILNTKNIVHHPDVKDPFDVFQLLHNQGYKRILLVAGGERADQYKKLKPYFGTKTQNSKTGKIIDLTNINPEDYNIHKIERDADTDTGGTEIESHMINPKTNKMDVSFVSGSKMRAHINSPIHTFMTMVPEHVTKKQAKELQDDMRKHMKILGLNEEVSAITRLKLARAARRTASRRKIVRRSRARRRRNLIQLKKRAKNEIISQLRKKFTRSSWKKVPYSQRVNIDRSLSGRKKMLNSMVKRIMPDVIKGESDRLRNLNNSYSPILDNFISNFITEASKAERNRRPVDSAQKAKRKRQNTSNQRNTRARSEEKLKSGNIRGEVYVVKNKRSGDVEIVDKKSLNKKTHDIIVDAKDASKGSVGEYLKQAAFVNTKTSIRLFGKKVKDAGNSKTKGESPTEEKKKKISKPSKEKKQKVSRPEPIEQMIPALKKASKKDTYATSHGATEMESGIVFAVNSALGLTPDQMVSKGLIDKKDVDAVLANKNESFMPSCQRAADQIIKQYGGLYLKHTGRLKKTTKLSNEAIDNGVRDNTPKSDLLLVDKNGKIIAGLSQKIGESQLSSGGPAETVTNLKYAMTTVGDKMQSSTKKEIEKFIKFFENELSGNPRTKQGPVGIYQKGGEREGEDTEVARREELHEKATDMLNKVLNGDKKFATAFIYSLVTGAGKFKEGDPAIATHILSANRDGTDLKMTPVDIKYAEKMIDKVKFQMKFKSSAVETSDVKKKWEEFKQRKKTQGQKVSLTEDFRAYSFRSVIRAYLSESFKEISSNKIIQSLFEESTSLKNSTPKEPETPEEAVDYLKDAFDYIGDDYFKLYQFFEDTIDPDVSEPIVDWASLAQSPSMTTNTVYINGKQFDIPVETPVNYSETGQITYPLSEMFLLETKKRNYRQEYDRYHSKPKQRKNRSKRVLARRLMMKLGKVHKGDGKDVDHKDGNPQNNGKHNLRVRGKSENRADND